MKEKKKSKQDKLIGSELKAKSHIFENDIVTVSSSIFEGYIVCIGRLKTEASGETDILLIPENYLVLDKDGLFLNIDAHNISDFEHHFLGLFSKDAGSDKASVDDHSFCNPLLFIEKFTACSPTKAEVCNFAYQLERLRADGLKLKTGIKIQSILKSVGSYCYIDRFSRINFYVSKEPSIYEGYYLAKAVHYKSEGRLIFPTPSYKLIKNEPGYSQRPLDVSPLGFIFSAKYVSDINYRNEMHYKLHLDNEVTSSLKTIFQDIHGKLNLELAMESKIKIQSLWG